MSPNSKRRSDKIAMNKFPLLPKSSKTNTRDFAIFQNKNSKNIVF